MKRSRDGESKEERRERKRLKKESKKEKKRVKQEDSDHQQSGSDDDGDNVGVPVFFNKKIELYVSLLPSALSCVETNIENTLRQYLLKYSESLGGILLTFDNVKILGKGGVIVNEHPHIHYRVALDALLFCPTVECPLSGVISEACFHSHLSLMVLHYFNASISAKDMRQAGFQFDRQQERWCGGTTALQAGDVVSFVCQRVFESGGIISIAGHRPTIR